MSSSKPSRRSFLKAASTSAAAAAVAGSGSLGALRAAAPVHQGGGKLKIGIVGIGGRGSGAAVQALMAHTENVLWAAGDMFVDHLRTGSPASPTTGSGSASRWRSGTGAIPFSRSGCSG